MTQPHKKLEPMSNTKTPNYIGPGEHSVRELEKMCIQFQQIISEMNASQFVKKDSVSSDVEQAAKAYSDCNPINAFKAGYKLAQSTQQPAITTLQQANAELQEEVDKWRDSANYYKDTYPVVIAELEKQNEELVDGLKDCREAIPAEMGNNPLWARINDIIAANESNK